MAGGGIFERRQLPKEDRYAVADDRFTETLTNASGKRVGRDAAVCTRLFDASHLCTGVYVLSGGQITVQLVQPGPSGTYTQAITGGTRRYAGASGTVTVRQDPAGDRFSFRVRVP